MIVYCAYVGPQFKKNNNLSIKIFLNVQFVKKKKSPRKLKGAPETGAERWLGLLQRVSQLYTGKTEKSAPRARPIHQRLKLMKMQCLKGKCSWRGSLLTAKGPPPTPRISLQNLIQLGSKEARLHLTLVAELGGIIQRVLVL